MLPWILGRALGLSAYLGLAALVVTGMWFRHPWRGESRRLRPAVQLRVHAALATATTVLVAGHVASLALDRYAGVGWSGAAVPGWSHYRPVAVGIGTVAVYLGGLVGATAALAGRPLIGRHWRPVHRLAAMTFVFVWCHGVTAGSDTRTLRGIYVGTGVLVATTAVTGWWARHRRPALAATR